MKLRSYIYLAGLLAFASTSAFADGVSVVAPSYSGAVWQNWSTVTNQAWSSSPTNTPFWNNSSWDGQNENVGGCLSVVNSGCAVPHQPGNMAYLGQTNGAAFTNFYFNNSGPVTMTFEAQVAGDAPYDTLGWYNVNNPNQYGIIFSGTTAIGTTATFTPSAQYGLFFSNLTSNINDVFFTNSGLNVNISGKTPVAVDTSYQHFAVFQQSAGNYWIGAEDLPSSGTDFDYNDMVVKMAPASAPEPSSLILLASGLVAFGGWKRWRKSAVRR
jgi:hypothetical protein